MLLARRAQSAQRDTGAVQRVNGIAATLIMRGSGRIDIGQQRTRPIAARMLELQQPVQRHDSRAFGSGPRQHTVEQPRDLIRREGVGIGHDASLASTKTCALPSSRYVTETCHGRQHT